jgi:murein DD-endopeptidase MepM/ murein hydrolase activator NlpD
VRGALAIALAAGLLLGGIAVSTSGAQSGADAPARARALALIAGGDLGPYADVFATGPQDEQHRSGKIESRGLNVRRGESFARTDVVDGDAIARASAVARSVDVFEGLVTAYGVRREVVDRGARHDESGRVSGLRIAGELIGEVKEEDKVFPLPDGAGTVTVNHGTVGLLVQLDKDLNGWLAGTQVRIAVARANARDGVVPEASPEPTAEPAKKKARKAGKGLRRRPAPAVRKRLTAGGFAFPVYGRADVADDFGGPRQIGPHQGNDVFADFGAPVIAVADGVLSRVGTLEISGNRLWLTTEGGDAFFYAHLSAFSPAAVDGAKVKAGTVVGFVGNTGDAEPTPPHVHFEVHPGGEEQDAVDPHQILLAWRGRRDVAPGAWLQRSGTDTAERPGALVAVRDFIAE